MEECKDIMVIDWATRIPTMPKRSICHICSVWEGDVDIGSTEWILMLHAGDLSIIRKRKMIENIEVSMDFCAKDYLM